MAMGMAMPAKLPAKLHTPPVMPINSFGATSEMIAQDMEEIPCAKNAKDKMAMAIMLEVVKLARKIEEASKKPVTIGSLRATDME